MRHIENLANMAKQGLFVYKGRDNKADATFVSGECAMIDRLLGAVRQRQASNAKFAYGIWHRCPTTPTCRARRRTP